MFSATTLRSWAYRHQHCVKSVHIRSFSGPYFPVFGLNTRRTTVSLRSQSECEKIRVSKTPNKETFHAVQEALNLLP